MLKANKGITMTSLVIYVIVLMIVITMLSTFTGYFFKNVRDITYVEESDEYYSKLLAYLTKDLNSDEVCFVKTVNDEHNNYMILKFKGTTGSQYEHQYIYSGETVYYLTENKKIHLCDEVSSCNFKYNISQHSVALNITINDKQYTKNIYVNVQ